MKTRIYIEPGTELDWENENHQRHIMDEAFEQPPRPRPTMKPPPRAAGWWFWRMFGWLVFRPIRRVWYHYNDASSKKRPDGTFRPWTHHYSSSVRVKKWISRGGRSNIRELLYWLLVQDYSICPHCGHTDYEDSILLFAEKDGDKDRHVEMFELVEGGGVDYWGEANSAYGWMWCYRCGGVEWEET